LKYFLYLQSILLFETLTTMFGLTKENGIYIYELLREFINGIIMYIIWIVLHYGCSNLYSYHCTPLTVTGFLLSPFYAVSPHCKALRWVIYNSGNSIEAMWFIIGSLIVKKLIPI